MISAVKDEDSNTEIKLLAPDGDKYTEISFVIQNNKNIVCSD